MCCQPSNRHGLPAPETDQRRRYSMDATEMEPCKIRHDPTPRLTHRGWKARKYLSFRSREKNVLDFSSYEAKAQTCAKAIFQQLILCRIMLGHRAEITN